MCMTRPRCRTRMQPRLRSLLEGEGLAPAAISTSSASISSPVRAKATSPARLAASSPTPVSSAHFPPPGSDLPPTRQVVSTPDGKCVSCCLSVSPPVSFQPASYPCRLEIVFFRRTTARKSASHTDLPRQNSRRTFIYLIEAFHLDFFPDFPGPSSTGRVSAISILSLHPRPSTCPSRLFS